MPRPLRSMTVRDIRDILDGYDDDTEVVIGYDYGDRGRTHAVDSIRFVEMMPLVESGYSKSGYAVDENDEDEPDDDQPQYVVISSIRQ